MKVKLVNQSLYMASRLGSIRLSTSPLDKRNAHVLLERLCTVKRNLFALKNRFYKLDFEKASEKRSTDKKLTISSSLYEVTNDEEGSEKREQSTHFS